MVRIESLRLRRSTIPIAVLLAVALFAASWFVFIRNDKSTPWFESLIADGPETLAELCGQVCVADLVVLPGLRVVESVVDLPMPETMGALSIERIWTGERVGIFGRGWESLWDIRLDDGTLSGPLPARPITAPERDSVEFADGTSMGFDDEGRAVSICADGARCTLAEWSEGGVVLSGGATSVTLELEDGRVVSATSADGRSVDYSYAADRLADVRSGAGSIAYAYEGDRLSAISGADPRTFEYEENVLRSMIDRDGQRWMFTATGPNVVQVTKPDGADVVYAFDDRALVSVSSTRKGLLLQRTFDSTGLLREDRFADGVTMTRVAPNEFEVTQVRDLEPQRRSRITFDQLGRVVRSVSSDGDMLVTYVGRSTRPATTRIGDNATTFEYDDAGLLVATTDPDGYRVTLDRDEFGLVRSLTDGVLETRFEYDAAGNPISEQSAGRTTLAQLAADGRVQALTLPNGGTVPVSYDASGNLTAMGLGDDVGVLAEVESIVGGPWVLDDATDEIVESAEGAEYRYRSGRLARFDDWGRLIELQVDGRSTTRGYDGSGRLTTLTRADGRTFTLTYTAAGRIASVSDGTITAELDWHGDLLTGVTTSAGSSYRYTYDASGRLTSSEVGAARWAYQYDDAGNLSKVGTPSSSLTYEWDELGRPREAIVDGQVTGYTWLGNGLDLDQVATPDETLIDFERNVDGQVIALDTVEGRASFEYSNGTLSGYSLGDGDDVAVTYGAGGDVESIEYGDTVEQWAWRNGELQTVTIDDERYDLRWLAPGVLASVERDGTALMEIDTDPLGRARSVRDEDGTLVGAFEWSSVGLRKAELDEWTLEVEHDDEARPVRLSADGVTLTSTYDSGLAVAVTAGGTSITSTYSDGRLVTSRLESGDQWTDVSWSADGQPTEFSSAEGAGAFSYESGRLTEVAYDDRVRKVTYDEDGRPLAEGTGGEFVDDLFGTRGVLTLTAGTHLTEPWAPWFDGLPHELGIELPSVITAEDVAVAAMEQATPDIPRPVDPTAGIAERTAATILALAAPAAFPVAGDRTATLPSRPDGSALESLLVASPTALVGRSVLENLAAGPCLLCRLLDAGLGAVSAIGRAGSAIVGFISESAIGRAVLSVAFFVASFALGALCGTSGLCSVALAVAAPLALGLLHGGLDSLPDLVAAAVLSPIISLWQGIRELDPALLLSAALTVAAFKAGASSNPRLATLRSKVVAPLCNEKVKMVVCVSVSRFGEAAAHVVDAQRNGAPRGLRIDRNGAAARRSSALRNVPAHAGFDRDEYPPAISSQRRNLSVRYVDPASNRSLGAYMARQLAALPDGARFFVLPIA